MVDKRSPYRSVNMLVPVTAFASKRYDPPWRRRKGVLARIGPGCSCSNVGGKVLAGQGLVSQAAQLIANAYRGKTRRSHLGLAVRKEGIVTWVMRRTGSKWLIAAAHNTNIVPGIVGQEQRKPTG